ncbi:MAG: hypothetical protein Q4E51_00755 [Lachnospiraceae bacterium]|nr:hypothetical protein [Lachnospiraceae bacterium]
MMCITMRKKYRIVICIFICLLSGCAAPKSVTFNGSMTCDENHYDITFDILNTTYSHVFEMKQGEKLLVHVEKDAGDIKILIQEGQNLSIYEGNGNVATDFSVDIPQDGTYTVSVSGKEAKGHIIFNRE